MARPRPGGGSGGGGAGGSTGRVLPELTISDVTVTEGGSVTFTVKLDTASQQTITVSYSTANGTALQGEDYTGKTGTLTFNPGQTTQTITLATTQDLKYEANETFFVNLSSSTNATIKDGQGAAAITNDDVPPTVSIVAASTIGEAGEQGEFSFVRSGGDISQALYASVSFGGTASAADFQYGGGVDHPQVIWFAPGETSANFTFTTLDDTLVEGDEILTATLQPVSGGEYVIGQGQATATIKDNDLPQPNVIRDDGDHITEDTLLGTSGEVDYFVFDLEANPGVSQWAVRAVVVGFEVGSDKVVFVNTPADATYVQDNLIYGDFALQAGGPVGQGGIEDTAFARIETFNGPTDYSVYDGATALLADVHASWNDVLVFTNDPWLIQA